MTQLRQRLVLIGNGMVGHRSVPFVPPLPGRDLLGCLVYRTIEGVVQVLSPPEAGRAN